VTHKNEFASLIARVDKQFKLGGEQRLPLFEGWLLWVRKLRIRNQVALLAQCNG